MATKKALWAVLAYPTSSDISKVIETLEGAGARVMWVLHDKDRHDHDDKEGRFKTGDPVDAHHHICCGWAKNAPDWKRFTEMLAACGAVCPGRRGKYDPYSARVESPEHIEDYFAHMDEASKQNPYKYVYGYEALNYSEGFNIEDYLTYEGKRARAKQIRQDTAAETAADFAGLMAYIKENHICLYSNLLDRLHEEKSPLFAAAVSNVYPLTQYMRSRYHEDIAELENHVESLKVELDARNARIAKCEEAMRDARRDIRAYQNDCSILWNVVCMNGLQEALFETQFLAPTNEKNNKRIKELNGYE